MKVVDTLKRYMPPKPFEVLPKFFEERKREVRTITSPSEEAEEKARTCTECFDKHLGGSAKLCEEGLDFYQRDGELTQRVQAKFRAIRRELAGMSDDIFEGAPSELREVYDEAQLVRKEIWSLGLTQGIGGTRDDMERICGRLKQLQDRVNEYAKRLTAEEARALADYV